jgi:YD repeat-containing protein
VKLTVIDDYSMMVRDPANGVLAVFARATPERFAMSDLWQLDGSRVSVRLSSPWDRVYVGGYMVNGLPISVSDPFGQYAAFQYGLPPASGDAQIDAKVTKILSTSGGVDLGYSAEGRLNSFTWADGTVQTLVLESTAGGVGPMLTGVKDEDDKRLSTFGYDADGYATSTERAGGTNKFSGAFTTAPQLSAVQEYDSTKGIYTQSYKLTLPSVATVTGPNGESVSVTSKSVRGQNVPTSRSQPAGSGCAASTRSQDFDANGNLNWKEDFRGYRSCYANDLTRNLNKTRVEGLANGSACAASLVDGAMLPAGSRKVTTAWHPHWRLETKVAEPRRLVTMVYNGHPDPFNSNAIASCAPGTALLPDGTPIAVLCKRVEQTTTDLDGSRGFNATLDTAPSVPKREEAWTYDSYGRVLTYSDPRSNVTTYGYFSDTTSDHTPGDLNMVINAMQQVIHYTKYNSAGQWLEMFDANGIATTRTFDLRQRLTSITIAGLSTTYDYWPTGLLKTVTLPDTSSVNYGYDDAHRLTSITDHLGNKITYTLDNSGTRIGESVTDPTGRLAKSLTRVPDALGRIQQVTGRE